MTRKTVTYEQPTTKEQGTYAALATALAVILSWAVSSLTSVEVPNEVTVALATLIGWATGKWGT